MKKILSPLFCLATLLACDVESTAPQGDEDKLVLNVALTNPTFPCYDCRRGSDEQFEEIKSKFLLKTKALKWDSSGLEMNLHSVNLGASGDFPHVIVYLNNHKDFEYAFSFDDELYYLEQPFLVHDERLRAILDQRCHLQDNLNISAARLHINSLNSEKQINRFVTVFFDSLLECSEMNLKELDLVTADMKRAIDFVGGGAARDSCTSNYDRNIRNMRNEIKNKTARYFAARRGVNGYWRIQIDTVDNLLFIKTSLKNYQCYTSMSL
jgi:hypothetical protein